MPFDPSTAWAWLLAAASALVLLANAAEKVAKAVSAAKKPNLDQDKRLDILEARMAAVERKLTHDKDRLDAYGEGERVTQQAILALLDHGLDGNNIDQMRHAKQALQDHLLNK